MLRRCRSDVMFCIVMLLPMVAVMWCVPYSRAKRTSQGEAVITHAVRITFRASGTHRSKNEKAVHWTAFVFVLYSQFRFHVRKVNGIKDFWPFVAISCASKIDAYCSRILLTHSINSFSSLIFDINNTAHTTEIKINASISWTKIISNKPINKPIINKGQ